MVSMTADPVTREDRAPRTDVITRRSTLVYDGNSYQTTWRLKMGLIDIVANEVLGLDVGALSKKVGLPTAVVDSVLVALARSHANGDENIVAEAASDTEVPQDKVQTLLDELGGPDALMKVAGLITGGGHEDALGDGE